MASWIRLLWLAWAWTSISSHADAKAYSCTSSGAKCCPQGSTCSGKLPTCTGSSSTASQLWGCKGELWDHQRLVMDWSYAGYKASEVQLPNLPVVANIKTQFGAVGDGKADDTAALLKAVSSVTGVIYFPAGTYVIKKQINIRKAVVLRGAGRDATKLYFPYTLDSLLGNTWPGGESEWAHGKCFINFMGWDPVQAGITRLAKIVSGAALASRTVQVDSTKGISAKQWVRITMSDPGNGAMVKALLGNEMSPGWVLDGARDMLRFETRVSSISGNQLVLERALPWAVNTAFAPEVHAIKPMLQNAGVEHLAIEFPWTNYPGHLKEKGYNALHFNQMYNSWIKDVRITNSDSAIYSWGSSFITVQDVEVTDSPKPRGTSGDVWWHFMDCSGHRGIWLEAGGNNKVQRVNAVHKRVHDLSVATFESGSVFDNCKGEDVALDFHKSAPYANLYSDIDLGAATRPFLSGGGEGAGPNTGGLETFWNLRGNKPIALPSSPQTFGPLLNFIGLEGQGNRDGAVSRMPFGWVVEYHQGNAYPQNLFQAMHTARMGW